MYAHIPKYIGKVLFVKKGHRLSFRYHEKKNESMYIYQGKALITTEGSNANLIETLAEPGYGIHIEPFTKHPLEAPEDTTFLEVSTPELTEVVRLEYDFDRTE